MTIGTDRRWQMTMTMTARHSQVVTPHGKRALVARVSYLSQNRPEPKLASLQVCCAIAMPTMRDMERVKRIGRDLVGRPRQSAGSAGQQSGELEAYSDADWGGDKATRRSVFGLGSS